MEKPDVDLQDLGQEGQAKLLRSTAVLGDVVHRLHIDGTRHIGRREPPFWGHGRYEFLSLGKEVIDVHGVEHPTVRVAEQEVLGASKRDQDHGGPQGQRQVQACLPQAPVRAAVCTAGDAVEHTVPVAIGLDGDPSLAPINGLCSIQERRSHEVA